MKFIVAIILFVLHSKVRARAALKCNPRKMHIPNLDDPYSFYKCTAGGVPVLFQCPAGTRFDEKLEICNWDTHSGSVGGNGEGTNGSGSGGGTNGFGSGGGSNAEETGTGEEGSNNNQENNNGPERMDCTTDVGNGPPRMYQNPEDCNTYYTCNMRRPVLTYCPRGLFFNPDTKGCDNTVPEGCQLVDPNKPGGSAIYEEQRKLRLKLMKKMQYQQGKKHFTYKGK